MKTYCPDWSMIVSCPVNVKVESWIGVHDINPVIGSTVGGLIKTLDVSKPPAMFGINFFGSIKYVNESFWRVVRSRSLTLTVS